MSECEWAKFLLIIQIWAGKEEENIYQAMKKIVSKYFFIYNYTHTVVRPPPEGDDDDSLSHIHPSNVACSPVGGAVD